MKHIANLPAAAHSQISVLNQPSRWIATTSRISARRGVVLATAGALWLPTLLTSSSVAAQGQTPSVSGTVAVPSAGAVTAPMVNPAAANGVNVLIVAFDNLSLPVVSAPVGESTDEPVVTLPATAEPMTPILPPALAPPVTSAPAGAITPNLPTSSSVPQFDPAPQESPSRPAITPANSLLTPLPYWNAVAAKKPPIEDDKRFEMKPEPLKTYTPDKNDSGMSSGQSDSASGANAAGATNPSSTTGAGGAFGTDDFGSGNVVPTSPFALGSGNLAGSDGGSAFVVGASQMASAPLRRALVAKGFPDVLTAAPGSNTLQRVVNSNRLSPRVVEALRIELARLALATATPSAVPGENSAIVEESAAVTAAPAGAQPASAQNAMPLSYSAAYRAGARIGQAVGYRAVIAMGMLPQETREGEAEKAATFVMMIIDASRETGDQLVFRESGSSVLALNESAALVASAYIARETAEWPALTERDKTARADAYMLQARASVQAGNIEEARDTLNQVLAFDPKRTEARLLLADMLRSTDPSASARVYNNVLEQGGGDGPTWAKSAIAFTLGDTPDWPAALTSARKALALKYDSAALRQAMATAELGRAILFRNAERIDSAERAEEEAEKHLNRALELAPDDPTTTRLMMRQLVQSGRYAQALLAMDRIVVMYPDDVDLQSQYAVALLKSNGRDEDAFAAWSRVFALSGEAPMSPDTFTYRHLAEGFDQRESNIGKRAGQLSASVAAGNTSREAALVQMNRYAQDAEQASVAIKALTPTLDGRGGVLHASRVASADLMTQAIANHQTYLETGQGLYRDRANELHRQAIIVINMARTGR